MDAAALWDALKAKDLARLRALVEQDPALVHARAPDGTSVLLQALYMRATPVATWLVEHGAPVGVHEAAALGDVPRLRHLVATDAAALHASSPDGWTPLHLAAHFGRLEATEALLGLGADAARRSTNGHGNTALHAALAGANQEVARRLIKAGAPIEAADAQGHTPLHLAAANGLVDIIQVLLSHGARRDAKDHEGKTPLDLARAFDEPEAAALLADAVRARKPL